MAHPWTTVAAFTAVAAASAMDAGHSHKDSVSVTWRLGIGVLEVLGLMLLPVPLYFVARIFQADTIQLPLLLYFELSQSRKALSTVEKLSVVCYSFSIPCEPDRLALLACELFEDHSTHYGAINPLTCLYSAVALAVWGMKDGMQGRLWVLRTALRAAVGALAVVASKGLAEALLTQERHTVVQTAVCTAALMWGRRKLVQEGEAVMASAYYSSFLLALLIPATTKSVSLSSSSFSLSCAMSSQLVVLLVWVIQSCWLMMVARTGDDKEEKQSFKA